MDNAYSYDHTQLRFGNRNAVTLSYQAATPATGRTATGTAGTTTLASGGLSTFTDATSLSFTAAMVGQTITVTGGSHTAVSDGVFLITGFTSTSVITIYNPYAVVDSVLSWAVLPSPSISQGDVSNAYLTVLRSGVGVTSITTVDPFPQLISIGTQISPSTGFGNWHVEAGTPVQNLNGVHPFFPGVSVPINSITIPITTYSGTTATDLVPTKTATGTNGAPTTTPTGGNYATFVDATAHAFTPAMVGSPITISGDAVNAGNNGTFTILSYVNAQTITYANPAAVATTGLTSSVTIPATISVELTFNNGPTQ